MTATIIGVIRATGIIGYIFLWRSPRGTNLILLTLLLSAI